MRVFWRNLPHSHSIIFVFIVSCLGPWTRKNDSNPIPSHTRSRYNTLNYRLYNQIFSPRSNSICSRSIPDSRNFGIEHYVDLYSRHGPEYRSCMRIKNIVKLMSRDVQVWSSWLLVSSRFYRVLCDYLQQVQPVKLGPSSLCPKLYPSIYFLNFKLYPSTIS